MNVDVMLVGDYFHALADMYRYLLDDFTISPICFVDTTEYNNLDIPYPWKIIDFRDFHELTISTMEIEPDVVVYLSPYLRKVRAENQPDLADMANVEAVEHLRETIGIHNSHLVLIWKDVQKNTSAVLQKTLRRGQNMVKGMGKATVIITPEIVDSSPEGYLAWKSSKSHPISEEVITSRDLAQQVANIITKSKTGTIKAEPTKIDETTLPDVPKFVGDAANFE